MAVHQVCVVVDVAFSTPLDLMFSLNSSQYEDAFSRFFAPSKFL